MFITLARKYRPQTFEEFVGQSHIVETLKKGIKENKTAYAYLFAGPRGVGKTSMARVFAKALNCEKGPTVSPCNECDICREITAGSFIDVLEIDGASNRGIEEVRNLRENVNLMPSKSRYKIYIIDEVHMLTTEAFNALLKTLEEPPQYVKFIFATTSPEKVLPTILSRCQRFDFRPLSPSEMKRKLKEICEKEMIGIEEKAIDEIVDFSSGSMRDALTILDQLVVYSGNEKITFSMLKELLGLVEEKSIEELLIYLRDGKIKDALELYHDLLKDGKEVSIIVDGIIKKLRNIGIYMIEKEKIDEREREFASKFENLPVEKILDSLTVSLEYKEKIKRESLQVVIVEILLLKLSNILKGEKRYEEVEVKKKEIFEEKEEKEIGMDDVDKNWSKILKKIKERKPTVEACLREGRVERVEDGKIYISFKKKFSFHKSMVERDKNKNIIEKVIYEILGKNFIIIPFIKEESSDGLLKEEIKKIRKFFDIEIMETEEKNGRDF